jgi:LysM repeat protein
MTNPNYDSDYEFDDYEVDAYRHRDPRVTNVGLPPGQLALIIGVNAVISLIISVMVVLIANRQATPGSVVSPAELGTPAATVSAGGANSEPTAADLTQAQGQPVVPTQVTPVESVTYEVQAGDTLGLIAEKFSVSVYDLMVANGLSDEDFIQIGQELVVPLGGLPTVTATFTPIAQFTETPLPFDPPTPLPTEAQGPPEPAVTVGPSPTPTITPPITTTATGGSTALAPPATPGNGSNPINIVITEVIDPGSLPGETLIVLNQGMGTSMLNWKLSGSPLGNFVFPDIFLFSGGSIRVHSVAGQNTPSDLYLGQSEPAWPSGATIVLSNDTGTEISRYMVP